MKQRKIRAIELYANNSPFKQRIVANKKAYKRNKRSAKHED